MRKLNIKDNLYDFQNHIVADIQKEFNKSLINRDYGLAQSLIWSTQNCNAIIMNFIQIANYILKIFDAIPADYSKFTLVK